MQIYVARLNIEHFRRLIAGETDPKKLEILRRLLAEEEAKLAQLLARAAIAVVKRLGGRRRQNLGVSV